MSARRLVNGSAARKFRDLWTIFSVLALVALFFFRRSFR